MIRQIIQAEFECDCCHTKVCEPRCVENNYTTLAELEHPEGWKVVETEPYCFRLYCGPCHLELKQRKAAGIRTTLD